MVNILHIMGSANYGGISSVVLNYYSNIDRTKYHFDFAIRDLKLGPDGQALKQFGCKFFLLPSKSDHLIEYCRQLESILRENDYQVVHSHGNQTAFIDLLVAKRCSIPSRIAHAHTSCPFTSLRDDFIRRVGCLLNYHYASTVIGCGTLAAKRVFGKVNYHRHKTIVLPNAIDVSHYFFNPVAREQIRCELGVQDCFVVGMVGRLSPEKNYPFAIKIIAYLKNLYPNIVLVCAGDGSQQSELLDLAFHYNVLDNIRFLGRREDVNLLYSAFDIQIMPSIHEGFPVAAVEALSSGLTVLASNTITEELSVFEDFITLPIYNHIIWANKIIEFLNKTEKRTHSKNKQILYSALNIKNSKQILESIYANSTIS